MNEETLKNTHIEVMNLRKLDHPNILTLHEIFEDNDNFYVITEMVNGGDLFD